MRALRLFHKTLREQLREPLMLGVTVAFGAAFMLIFGLAFGESYYTYRVAVRDLDGEGGGTSGAALVARLESAAYDDGVHLFEVERVGTLAGVEVRLQRRELFAAVEIPAGFSAALGGGAPAVLSVTGDPANAGFGLVRMVMQGVLDDYLAERGGAAPPATLRTSYLTAGASGGGEFTYLAPGLMLVAIFLLLIQCSMVIVREVQAGTMLRLRLSPMRTWEFLFGIAATQVLFSALMLPLMYGTACLVGFRGSGHLGAAFVVGLAASGVAISLGLVNAAISRTVVQAFLWGNLLTIPVVFLSGAFFPLPEHVLFTIAGHRITWLDWLPSAPAVAAMNGVLIYGAGLGDVTGELVKLLVMSALFFALGVALFSRTHLRRA